MAVEGRRGCGFRKIGGLYLVADGPFHACDRMPIPLEICPCCGQGIKQSRGFTWVEPDKFLEGEHLIRCTIENEGVPCECTVETKGGCAVCRPELMGEKAGLLWVGEKFYTPQSFSKEANLIGISKRIAGIPKDLELGKTWILMAHPKAVHRVSPVEDDRIIGTEDKYEDGLFTEEFIPGIFMAFVAKRVEQLVPESISDEDKEKLEKRGITPIPVPVDDVDHWPDYEVKW